MVYGCAGQKDTFTNRQLHNLSARYNLIYNSNILLEEYLDGIHQDKPQDFNSLLPLYHAPEAANVTTAGTKIKELDEIDQKARTVIAEKNLSNYLDDAYIILGKTNFYQGKFYNASAYFDYVARAYKTNHKTYLNALNWKARSFIALEDYEMAEKALDTVKIELDSVKRRKSEPLSTLAQMSMIKEDYPTAISFLEKALKAKPSTRNRINWTYTLAQLYENEKEYTKSLAAYRKIEKSNAPFEMHFNAKLSRIRINEQLEGKDFDRKQQLTRMLKDEKNVDFTDQIYYEIAEHHYQNNEYEKAEEYYDLSVQSSTINQVQKAISYLKIADINFQHYNDYITAKKYYDSTARALPRNHPLYNVVINKVRNLAHLQNRYETIGFQDTLQKIAQLPVNQRELALSNYFASIPTLNSDEGEGEEDEARMINRTVTNYASSSRTGAGSFYFSSGIAISRGLNDFKKRWGNRKLENNWRQSIKSNIQSSQDTPDAINEGPGHLPENPDEEARPDTRAIVNKAVLYLDSIPLTPAMLEQSNQKIIAAYMEIANFYQQVLQDRPEAIKTYQTLLKRFPNNDKLDRLYYGLYLAYRDIDPKKSDEYKNLVLSKYPNSVFAQTIKDPNFSLKKNQLEATLNKEYEALFDRLQNKEFKNVITGVDQINQRFPGNKLAAQYDYLKAIAIGRTESIDQLIASFKKITETYKTDRLVKPLVEQHLLYINAHLNSFKKRKIALIDYDPNEIPFVAPVSVSKTAPIIAKKEDKKPVEPLSVKEKPIEIKENIAQVQPPPPSLKRDSLSAPIAAVKPDSAVFAQSSINLKNDSLTLSAGKKDSITAIEKPILDTRADSTIAPVIAKTDTLEQLKAVPSLTDTIARTDITTKPAPVKDNLFNAAASETYYYVVAVNTTQISLSTSRFGIGQFNRGNYAGSNLRHQLKEMAKDQLIIVGDFRSPNEVTNYQQNIKAQLGVIIKAPANNYTTFAISKENLDKITDRETLERYIRYINDNEL